MIALLGASYRTGGIGVVLIGLSVVLFCLGRPIEGVAVCTAGLGFLNTRDAAVTSVDQARDPGIVTRSPDVTVTESIQPTVQKIVEGKIKELVNPQIEALDKQKADRREGAYTNDL